MIKVRTSLQPYSQMSHLNKIHNTAMSFKHQLQMPSFELCGVSTQNNIFLQLARKYQTLTQSINHTLTTSEWGTTTEA